MSAHAIALETAPYALGSHSRAPVANAVLAGVGSWLARRRQHRRAQAAMTHFDEYLSRDIGLSRDCA